MHSSPLRVLGDLGAQIIFRWIKTEVDSVDERRRRRDMKEGGEKSSGKAERCYINVGNIRKGEERGRGHRKWAGKKYLGEERATVGGCERGI